MPIFKKAVKIACIMNETEIENREKAQTNRKYGARESSSHGNGNFKRFRVGVGWNKGKHPAKKQRKKTCDHNGRQHYGLCKSITRCFGCGEIDHRVANCPKATWNNQGDTQRSGVGNNVAAIQGHPPAVTLSGGSRNNKKSNAEGRIFCIEGEETEEPANTVLGILLVNQLYAPILFDSSAIRSFVNSIFAKKLVSKPDEMHV